MFAEIIQEERIMKAMTKALVLFCALSLCFVGVVSAKVLDAGVFPTADAQGNVTIPQLPNGKILQIYVWNDSQGAAEKKLGATHSFKLNPGDGFNFTWSGPQGVAWQLVTRGSQVGGSLVVDDSWKDANGKVGCKYLFPGK
ncbi:MAG: hypothetical protein WC643_00175 [Parcubacteria group bacterium]